MFQKYMRSKSEKITTFEIVLPQCIANKISPKQFCVEISVAKTQHYYEKLSGYRTRASSARDLYYFEPCFLEGFYFRACSILESLVLLNFFLDLISSVVCYILELYTKIFKLYIA